MSLSNKALLANLSISQWTGRKHDKRATATVESSHLTQGKVGQYSKKLLPGAKELETIHSIAQSMRVFFYDNTLPWYSDGSRILSSKNYLDFTNNFRAKKQAFDNAVTDFLNEYPALRERAKLTLGDLFQDNDYPTANQIANTFTCEISFMPIPEVGDFRVTILDEEKTTFLNRMQDAESAATKECWNRLYGLVSKAANRLNSSDSIIRDSLIENIVELCNMLPKLNVTDDPTLETMRQEVERLVVNINPTACRESVDARAIASNKLDAITAKMSAFMGAL